MPSSLKPGDAAPAFELPTADGPPATLAGLRGKPVVLYFYPKDDTSGCTKEAIAFSQAKPDFDALSIAIVGVSADSPQAHARFAAKHGLTVTLGADTRKKTIADYGVWVEKSMYGRKYMGIERATFLIDADGRIARVWRRVKVPGHVDEVLRAAKEL